MLINHHHRIKPFSSKIAQDNRRLKCSTPQSTVISLDIAEIELNVTTRQRLDRRIYNIADLKSELAAWESERNDKHATVNWQFRTGDAIIKLKSLYPVL